MWLLARAGVQQHFTVYGELYAIIAATTEYLELGIPGLEGFFIAHLKQLLKTCVGGLLKTFKKCLREIPQFGK
jgi:hypothetical protein